MHLLRWLLWYRLIVSLMIMMHVVREGGVEAEQCVEEKNSDSVRQNQAHREHW